MNALEHEIIEKFRMLSPDAKARVWALIEQDMAAPPVPDTEVFDYDTWFTNIDALREHITASTGGALPDIDVAANLPKPEDGDGKAAG